MKQSGLPPAEDALVVWGGVCAPATAADMLEVLLQAGFTPLSMTWRTRVSYSIQIFECKTSEKPGFWPFFATRRGTAERKKTYFNLPVKNAS